MLNPLDLSADAPWKQRFRAPSIECCRAAQDPSRALVRSDKDGLWQLYAWQADTDALTRLTHDPAGVSDGVISADGEWIYYLRDSSGNEIGPYARVPFAGGLAVVASADWTLMYEDQAGALRGYQRSMFGGAPAEKPEAHRKSSPITYAEQIAAPILVLQGENDTRCPARQMRVYEERLKELGKSIEVHWFDAGHGSLDTEERIWQQELMLRSACRQIHNSV